MFLTWPCYQYKSYGLLSPPSPTLIINSMWKWLFFNSCTLVYIEKGWCSYCQILWGEGFIIVILPWYMVPKICSGMCKYYLNMIYCELIYATCCHTSSRGRLEYICILDIFVCFRWECLEDLEGIQIIIIQHREYDLICYSVLMDIGCGYPGTVLMLNIPFGLKNTWLFQFFSDLTQIFKMMPLCI